MSTPSTYDLCRCRHIRSAHDGRCACGCPESRLSFTADELDYLTEIATHGQVDVE